MMCNCLSMELPVKEGLMPSDTCSLEGTVDMTRRGVSGRRVVEGGRVVGGFIIKNSAGPELPLSK